MIPRPTSLWLFSLHLLAEYFMILQFEGQKYCPTKLLTPTIAFFQGGEDRLSKLCDRLDEQRRGARRRRQHAGVDGGHAAQKRCQVRVTFIYYFY